MTITDKQNILNLFKQQIENKISILKNQIKDLAEDAQNDAKGSAGDKHETGLAMMHLEQEKLSAKLVEALKQQQILNSIVVSTEHQVVSLGSLVQITTGYFFVSDALLQINYQGINIFPLSVKAPIYEHIKNSKVNDTFTFNFKQIKILALV